MKVKMFTNEADAPKLEKEISQWLRENPDIKITHIKQSYAYDNMDAFHTLISVWYS